MARNSDTSTKAQSLVGRPRSSGADIVYSALRRRILSLELQPGIELDGRRFAEEYKVSRTLVREAFIRLATDGHIQLLPNRSARVSFLELSEIPELLESLELFGRTTTRWAAARRTEDDLQKIRLHRKGWRDAAVRKDFAMMSEENNRFHESIAVASGNKYIAKTYRTLLSRYRRLSYTLYSGLPQADPDYLDYYTLVDDDHGLILDAIVAGDTNRADQMAQRHALQIRMQIANYLGRTLADNFQIDDPRRGPNS